MKRLYVLPHAMFHGSHTTNNGANIKHTDLFHSTTGGHYILLTGGMILAALDFHDEAAEDYWHEHPEVAPLPHPTFEGNLPLQAAVDNPTRNLQQHHLDALDHIGVLPTHSVLDVSNIAKTLHPLVRIRPLV